MYARLRRSMCTSLALALVSAVFVPSATARLGPGTTSLRNADVTIAGEAAGDESGYQVDTGDFDGDGVGDLAIGAWQNDGGGDTSGAVYILYGPLRRDVDLKHADVRLTPPKAGDYVGEGPLGVTDLDGDGTDDLLIGAPGSFYLAQPGSPGKIGETYLLYGGRRLRGDLSLPKVAHAVFTGVHMTEWLGFGAGGVGDLDDDGFEDAFIGAPGTAAFTGAGYLFYGRNERFKGTVPVTRADAIILGDVPGQLFGYQSIGGNFDDDQADDLFVSSRPLPGEPASVHVFYGGERLSGVVPAARADARLVFPSTGFVEGPTMTVEGDLNGDHKLDLVIGDSTGINTDGVMHVYVLFGGTRLTGTSLIGAAADLSLAGAGSAVAVGDVNRDNRSDLVAGASGAGEGGDVYVFLGPLDEGEQLQPDGADTTLSGPDGSSSGSSLAVGALNRDRVADIAIGAPGDAGRTFVMFGRRF